MYNPQMPVAGLPPNAIIRPLSAPTEAPAPPPQYPTMPPDHVHVQGSDFSEHYIPTNQIHAAKSVDPGLKILRTSDEHGNHPAMPAQPNPVTAPADSAPAPSPAPAAPAPVPENPHATEPEWQMHPRLQQAIQKIWMDTNGGQSPDKLESSFIVDAKSSQDPTPDLDHPLPVPMSYDRSKQAIQYHPGLTKEVWHIHNKGADAQLSPEDIAVAKKGQFRIYAVSQRGVEMFDPAEGKHARPRWVSNDTSFLNSQNK